MDALATLRFRQPYSKSYPDGRTETFDPLLRWSFNPGIWDVSLRGDWGVGLLHGYRIGDYSCFRTRYLRLGRITFYLHLGRCAPHDPRRAADRRQR